MWNKSEYDKNYLKENTEQIRINVLKGEKARLQEEAEKQGLSMRQYIIDAVNDKAGKVIISTRESRKKERENKG